MPKTATAPVRPEDRPFWADLLDELSDRGIQTQSSYYYLWLLLMPAERTERVGLFEIADELRVDRRTVNVWERELEHHGLVERVRVGKGYSRRVLPL